MQYYWNGDPDGANSFEARMRKRLELYGWLLFLVGIVLWVIQTVLTRDVLGMLGGVAWLVGCSLFILSYRIKNE